MDKRDQILNYLREKGFSAIPQIAKDLGMSRQLVHYHLYRLLDEALVEKVRLSKGVVIWRAKERRS